MFHQIKSDKMTMTMTMTMTTIFLSASNLQWKKPWGRSWEQDIRCGQHRAQEEGRWRHECSRVPNWRNEKQCHNIVWLWICCLKFSFPAAGHLHSWREIWASRFSKKNANWLLFCTWTWRPIPLLPPFRRDSWNIAWNDNIQIAMTRCTSWK